MGDVSSVLEGMALHEMGRGFFERLLPSETTRLGVQATRLDIVAKKRMLGMPVSDDELEGAWGERHSLAILAPNLSSAMIGGITAPIPRRQLTGPRPASLATLMGNSERSLFKRGISNASRSITRRLFG